VAGNEITLSAVERRLLSRLVENIGQVVTREQLLDEIYDASGSIVNDNTLSVYLKRLRKKLGPSVTIETIKSVGYRLRGETNT
jgi:DNA-binding response OmpR family regulator